ncbi:MAG: dihydrolipoyl dehydrogenase [Candidatus Sericytochromatia bacterium]
MHYDLIVIGSGPGGYVGAIRAAQLGFKTAIVEKYPTLGGTCLNVGCIPSKALLDSSERYAEIKHLAEHGIDVPEAQVDLKRMIARKQKVVEDNAKGVSFLMKKNKITVYTGHASLTDAHSVKVGDEILSADRILLATGSKPSSLPGVTPDKQRIITSTEALALETIPQHLIVIGGGIIGLELGSVYARLGSKVSVVEYTDRLIPTMDQSLGSEMQKILKRKLGFDFYLSHKVTGAVNHGESVTVSAEAPSGEILSLEGDICLVAVGRRAYTEGLGLEALGIEVDKAGRIPVNAHLQTSQPHIYAIGDVVTGPMLAHKAEEEGVFAAEHMADQQPHIDYRLIPSVLYTWPEAAGVGDTEQALKAAGRPYKSGSFPFKALGRARASSELDGMVKVLADAETDEILGVHIVGARAADLIAEAVVAMEFRASAEDISRISHAHPTYSEAMKEACLAATAQRPLHL